MRLKSVFSFLAFAGTVAMNSAMADIAINSFSGGVSYGGFSTDETVGFVFDANADISVTQLGWYSAGGTVNASHQIGIWDALGTLLGSATVSSGTTDGTGFRYVSLTPILLLTGQQYFIGGRDLTNDGDDYVTSVSNLVTDSDITFVGSAVSADGSGFAYPDRVNTITTGGRFGANFIFDVVTADIPEPASLALLGLGLAGLGFSRRRKA